MNRLICVVASLFAVTSFASMVQKPIGYSIGKTQFEGVLIYDDAVKTPRPGMVVVPNWLGITPANLKQAELLAGSRYVVFVADTFGKAGRPKGMEDAGKVSGAVKADRKLYRERVNEALKQLKAQKVAAVDAKKIGAFGFCFGGTGVLELARSGADVAGVVVFHGGLSSPTPDDAKNIKAKVLALQGADDPYVPADETRAFEDEMRKGNVDWQLVQFGGTVHSYTDLDAHQKGQADYNEKSAKRAYAMMSAFFDELFTAN